MNEYNKINNNYNTINTAVIIVDNASTSLLVIGCVLAMCCCDEIRGTMIDRLNKKKKKKEWGFKSIGLRNARI